ncbi:MAG: PAS domain S-box protein [Arhodomonas sp.]|nr:PAS domain S-box protein [Arhodomonas sp.]
MADQGIDWNETRPDRLQQLREQIERNLSGMMGPILARMIVDERLRVDTDTRTALAQNVRLIEERLERSRSRFRGLAAELDELRRYHRQILEDLPLGVVAVTPSDRIVRWNPAMQALTGLSSARVIGRRIQELRPPWGELLGSFLACRREPRLQAAPAPWPRRPGWLSLHRAAIGERSPRRARRPAAARGGRHRAAAPRGGTHPQRAAGLHRPARRRRGPRDRQPGHRHRLPGPGAARRRESRRAPGVR